MLCDYLRSFWLGVLHNKANTLINVCGLALGLAVFIALTFYVYREFSWDDHWEDADNIYQAVAMAETASGGDPQVIPVAPWVVGTMLQARNVDAFATYTRVYRDSFVTLGIDGEDYVSEAVMYAEPSILDLVQLDTLEGSLQDVFDDPRAIAVDIDVVNRLFGGRSLLGKTITLHGRAEHVVKAIYHVPQPTSLDLSMLALLDPAALPVANVAVDLWDIEVPPPPAQSQSAFPPVPQMPLIVSHYFKLLPGFSLEQIAGDLQALMDEGRYMENAGSKTRVGFRKLQDVHLGASILETDNNVLRLWAYVIIGSLVLLISGCNFVMLATLRSVDRMREVGIRKTLGGEASQLLRRYLLDAFLLTFAAACLALALLEVFAPLLNRMLILIPDLQIGWRGLATCLGIVTGFALLSGLYPAWLMSRGKPATLLRSSSSGELMGGGSSLRKLLVAIQFSVVIGLLLGSAVLQQQIAFMQSRDRGFSLDDVLGIKFRATEIQMHSSTLVNEFARVPGVQQAAVGLPPGAIMIGSQTVFRRINDDGSLNEALIDGGTSVGAGYFHLMSVRMLAGREFSEEVEGAPQTANTGQPWVGAVILNASAVRALGFDTPDMAINSLLERNLRTNDGQQFTQRLRVIGVVADMQYVSLMLPPVPQAYSFSTGNSFMAVKLEQGADVVAVRSELEKRWHGVVGDLPFEPLTANQLLLNQLQQEESEGRIIIGSAVLAIVIAMLGLYGMAAASVVKRVKEIGVRKVMGADVRSIVGLMLWQFTMPVMVASLVAWLLGFWCVMQWLERFPYRLDMQVIVLSGIAASGLALSIAWLTVGILAAKAANQKPALALRYE